MLLNQTHWHFRQAKFAGFSVFQTHIFRVTGQQFGSFLNISCSQSRQATGTLRGSFATLSPKFFFSVLICFFRFFRANLLSAIEFVGWVRWRAAVLWTANQSGRKVHQSQHEALCKGLIINKLTLKSLQKPS